MTIKQCLNLIYLELNMNILEMETIGNELADHDLSDITPNDVIQLANKILAGSIL